MDRVIGIHAVEAALDGGRAIDRVIVARGAASSRLQHIIDSCREAGVPVRFEPREQLDRATGNKAHQGVVAFAAPKRYGKIEDLLEGAGPDAVAVVIDGVEDPHNLGAILRSAYAAGAAAAIVPERRSAGLTETVAKAAAGALEFLPVIRVKNINRTLEQLKEAQFWVYGLDERGEELHFEADLSGRVALVLGGEGGGLHRLTAERCDVLLRIPMSGKVASLNVSVAAGVALFEIVRQRSRQPA